MKSSGHTAVTPKVVSDLSSLLVWLINANQILWEGVKT
jgi:hypothetical protein